jgi:hypothetical protein
MYKTLWFILIFAGTLAAAELQEETDVKFAFYSSAWGENTDDGLRLVAFNQTQSPVRLDSIIFLKTAEDAEPVAIQLDLDLPAMGYADAEFPYIDLLLGDDCIDRTMAENWKLVEISNYTLNPSVRNLIIQDTDSFRIYQCVENVQTTWTDQASNQQFQYEEWILYHFETR